MKNKLLLFVKFAVAGLFATTMFAQVPTISLFNPSSGQIGSSVIITGTNFNSTPANNIVFFGAVQAIVGSASPVSLTVTVPLGATYAPISVTNTASHLTGYSRTPFIVTFPTSGGIDELTFDIKNDFGIGDIPSNIFTGDLDGDGKSDIIVSTYIDSISVFRFSKVL